VFFSQGHQGSLPDDMPIEQVTYEWFAENYKFTEDMTDGLSLDALEWWPVIRSAKHHAQEMQRAQDERAAKNARR
jgi:hypothetical protein